MTCSKKIRPATGESSTWVRENSACSTDGSYRYPAAASSAVNGYGSIASSLAASASILPASRLSQIACTAATSSTAAKPLSSGVNPMPALAACRLAYSLPLMISLNNPSQVAGSGVVTGHGGCAHADGSAAADVTSSSDEKLGDWFSTACPLSVVLGSWSHRYGPAKLDFPGMAAVRRHGWTAS
jgi:hypothetical protein